MYLNLLSFCGDPPSCIAFCSEWYKKELKENNAWFIYALGVNFAERIFLHVKSCDHTF